MTITERIFFLIKERGLSQNAFGKAAGIAPSTISDWKTKGHTPSAEKIMDICRVLEITPEVLLTGKGIDEPDVTVPKIDYTAKELLIEYEGLNEDAQKRLLTYAKKLGELTKLEDI
ncbi:MAG: helix-turn-helix transcriptional regulator [Pseudobutyrivibrio sp.]|nr:helix-turn-helix transcriptional regulator [Pseudobutyrivibrio sp.]